MSYDRSSEACPKCGGQTDQESVDVGVGVIYGPLGCIECGWSEDPDQPVRQLLASWLEHVSRLQIRPRRLQEGLTVAPESVIVDP